MKNLISMATAASIALVSPALADEFPVSGVFSTGIAANGAQFSDVGKPDPGFTSGTLSATVLYTPVDPLTLSASMALYKTLDPGQAGEGTVGETAPGRTQIQDIGLDANYVIGSVGPVTFVTGLSLAVPLSENSKAFGLITAITPRAGLSFQLPATLSIALEGNISYNVLEDPTQQIDCTDPNFRNLCEVSKQDTGNPNNLVSYGASIGLNAQPVKGLTLSVGYAIGAGFGAVEFPDDEFTSPFSVSGTQYAAATHATRFGVSYALAGLLSGAEEKNPELAAPGEATVMKPEDSPFWAGISVSLGMSTREMLYSRDRDDNGDYHITAPLYDFETPQRSRTVYSFGLTYSI